MKTIHWAAATAVILLALTISPARAQQNLNEVRERFEAVKKVVDDPLTDEAGIRKALRDLEKLNQLSNDQIEDENDASKPALELAGAVAESLRSVKSRLPAELRSPRNVRPGIPVPKFEDRALLADVASGLSQSQISLARHLRKTDNLGEEGEALLFEVSKSQENLAWEAGWPFTKQEAEQVRSAGRLTQEAYESRLKRGTQRINEQIAGEIDANGREREREFVIHRSASKAGQKRLTQHLEEVRKIGRIPESVMREFDEKEAEAIKGGGG